MCKGLHDKFEITYDLDEIYLLGEMYLGMFVLVKEFCFGSEVEFMEFSIIYLLL